MPRYFFNTHVAGRIVSDLEGEAHPDRAAASQAARVVVQRLMRVERAHLSAARLVVVETGGDVVIDLPFVEARA